MVSRMTASVSSRATPDRLLRAAEKLFADHGLDGVSLRRIGREAGAGNVLAVQYWFTDRDGLIRALLERHHRPLEEARHRLLDAAEQVPEPERLRALARALVEPWSAELGHGASGTGYLRVACDLLHRPQPSIEPWGVDDPNSSMVRWRDALEPLLDAEAVGLHRRFRVGRFVISELTHRAMTPSRQRDDVFVSQLTDLAAGMLAAPVSDQTRQLLDPRTD